MDRSTPATCRRPIRTTPTSIRCPSGLGLFIDSARDPRNQAPVVVYYDRANGDLKLAKFDPTTGQFAHAGRARRHDDGDAGWSPSVAGRRAGRRARRLRRRDAATTSTYITDAPSATREIIDDGYRIVGQTVDGLPKPEFHFVGDDAGLVHAAGGTAPLVVYQDATTQELLLAQQGRRTACGRTTRSRARPMPWPGAYGFFASDALTADATS